MNPAAYDAYVQQQVQNATSSEVLISALRKLGPGAWRRSNESEQAAAERLGRSIKVTRLGTGEEVAISARAKDPGLAAQIANTVASSVVERAAKEGIAADAQRVDDLREERNRIQKALQADYAEQDALNKQLGLAAVGTAVPDLIDDQIARTREELIKAQADHDEAEARFTVMKGGGNSSAAISAEADDVVAADAGVASMKTTLNERSAVLIAQMADLTADSPAYKQDAEELAKIDGALNSMMNDLRAKAVHHIEEKLRTDVERTADVEAKLNGRLLQLAQTAAIATPKLQRLDDLAADIARMRNRFGTVDVEVNDILLEDRAPVQLSMAAVAPTRPAISGVLEGAVGLALGGLLLGVVVAVVLHGMDRRVNVAGDVGMAQLQAPRRDVAVNQTEVRKGAARAAEVAAPERAQPQLLMNASTWRDVTPALASLTQRTARSTPDLLWRREEPVQKAAEVARPDEARDVAPPTMASTPILRPEALPDWFWDVGSSGSGASAESGIVEKEKPVEGANPFEAESRLNGLRGLILTLELKKLNKRRGSARLDEESSSAESAAEPSLPARGLAEGGEAATAPATAPEANVASSEVTAEPEFLPPREFVPMREAKRARDGSEEGDEEIQILPARRGQYRSKG
jgi:capsular polysaccharide biosynthesis protein